MTKQEAAIKYITENYLNYRRLRHDIVADKLQVRVAHSLGEEAKGDEASRQEYWREMTKHDINSIVCHCAQEYDANITSREVMTALQSDLIPDVHPLREYVLSCGEWTEEQPDWIDFVALQVRVKNNDNIDNLRPNQYPLGAQGEYSSPRQEVDCRGMLSKLSSNKKNIGCRSAADVENQLTQLLLQAQNAHEEIILEVSDFTPGNQYGYNTPCEPELQKR
jgi:hypothetical protein